MLTQQVYRQSLQAPDILLSLLIPTDITESIYLERQKLPPPPTSGVTASVKKGIRFLASGGLHSFTEAVHSTLPGCH